MIRTVVFGAVLCFCMVQIAGCSKTTAELIEQAKSQSSKGDLGGALITAKSAAQQSPDLWEARLLLARLSNEAYLFAQAESEAGKAASLMSGDAQLEAVLELMRALRSQSKFSEMVNYAMPEFLNAPAPLRASVIAIVGRAKHALGSHEAAAKDLDVAKALSSDNAEVKLLEAQILAGRGELQGALAIVQQIVAEEPRNLVAWSYKAEISRAIGNRDDMFDAYGHVIEINPLDFNALRARASALIASGDVKGASKELNALAKFYPESATALAVRAHAALVASDPKSALELALSALAKSPKLPSAQLLAGAAHYELGSTEQAIGLLSAYLVSEPHSKIARRKLASAFSKSGQLRPAIEAMGPLVSGDSAEASDLKFAARLYGQIGEAKTALHLIERALSANPKSAELQFEQIALKDNSAADQDYANLESLLADRKVVGQVDEMYILHLVAKGRLDDAARFADELVTRSPDSAIAHNLLGLIHLKGNRIESAKSAFEAAVRLDQSFFPAALNLSQLDVAVGDIESAKQRFESLLQARPEEFRAQIAISQLEQARGDNVAAAMRLEEAISKSPDSTALYFELIPHYLRRTESANYERAEKLAESLLSKVPKNERAQKLLIKAYLASGKSNQAIKIFEDLIASRPKDPKPVLWAAGQFNAQGQTKEVERLLTDALKRLPNDAQLYRAYSAFLLANDRSDEALRLARSEQARRPAAPLGYILEGDALAALGKLEEAESVLELALQRQPVAPLAVRLFAVKTARSDALSAIAWLDDWSKRHANVSSVHVAIADQYLRLGRRADAMRHYDVALQAGVISKRGLNNLAWLSHEAGDERALSLAESARKADPQSPAALDTLGWILLQRGKLDEAMPLLREAVFKGGHNPQFLYHLAAGLKQSNKSNDARKVVTLALSKSGDFEEKQAAQKLLDELKQTLD